MSVVSEKTEKRPQTIPQAAAKIITKQIVLTFFIDITVLRLNAGHKTNFIRQLIAARKSPKMKIYNYYITIFRP